MKRPPILDPTFQPASLWKRAYSKAHSPSHTRPIILALSGPSGPPTTIVQTDIHGPTDANTCKHIERMVKFLLWQRGGCNITIAGCPEIAQHLADTYQDRGTRSFDVTFIGEKLYGQPIQVHSVDDIASIQPNDIPPIALGRHLTGCRIGFDLGGSDRKAAAVIDGKVVFSEEVAWDPYFQSDPQYHIDGIRHSLRRAAEHLPRIDAIGGSSAGVYVDNEVRAASLFRGVSSQDFEAKVKRIFFDVMHLEGWDDVPWNVVNDGDVTALAGSMSLEANNVLGVSMGTSEAAGYVDRHGNILPWLNELAFAPIDYRPDAPLDEWSGDRGCGVQYFSQQAVARLVPIAGIELPDGTPFAEQLEQVQSLMEQGDDRAMKIYQTIGAYLGYTLPHYADFYEIDHLLILGRVTSGQGGAIIIEEAETVLETEFPDLAEHLQIHTPDEKDKRHGQAIAAASLPPLQE